MGTTLAGERENSSTAQKSPKVFLHKYLIPKSRLGSLLVRYLLTELVPWLGRLTMSVPGNCHQYV
jgi:hypothetical protein